MVSQWTREGKDEHVLGTASLSVELLIKDTLKKDEPLNKGQSKSTLYNTLKRTTSLQRTVVWSPKCVHYQEVPLY